MVTLRLQVGVAPNRNKQKYSCGISIFNENYFLPIYLNTSSIFLILILTSDLIYILHPGRIWRKVIEMLGITLMKEAGFKLTTAASLPSANKVW